MEPRGSQNGLLEAVRRQMAAKTALEAWAALGRSWRLLGRSWRLFLASQEAPGGSGKELREVILMLFLGAPVQDARRSSNKLNFY